MDPAAGPDVQPNRVKKPLLKPLPKLPAVKFMAGFVKNIGRLFLVLSSLIWNAAARSPQTALKRTTCRTLEAVVAAKLTTWKLQHLGLWVDVIEPPATPVKPVTTVELIFRWRTWPMHAQDTSDMAAFKIALKRKRFFQAIPKKKDQPPRFIRLVYEFHHFSSKGLSS